MAMTSRRPTRTERVAEFISWLALEGVFVFCAILFAVLVGLELYISVNELR